MTQNPVAIPCLQQKINTGSGLYFFQQVGKDFAQGSHCAKLGRFQILGDISHRIHDQINLSVQVLSLDKSKLLPCVFSNNSSIEQHSSNLLGKVQSTLEQ